MEVGRGGEEHVPIYQKKGQRASEEKKIKGLEMMSHNRKKISESSYQAQSMDIPMRRKRKYSSHEKG